MTSLNKCSIKEFENSEIFDRKNNSLILIINNIPKKDFVPLLMKINEISHLTLVENNDQEIINLISKDVQFSSTRFESWIQANVKFENHKLNF